MEEVTFLQKLLAIDSSNPPGNERDVALVLAERAERAGLEAEVTEFATNRCNLEIRLSKNRGKTIYLCGHMDTVLPGEAAWTYPPFSGEVAGDYMYGRGAVDMKSGLAAMFLALEAIHREKTAFSGEIVFLATSGEEVDCCGAREYVASGRLDGADALVLGEPTKEKVVIGHKGALWLEITTFGKTAHGSMPEQGVNAIRQMASVVHLIEQFANEWKTVKPPLGSSSMAVTKIAGGVQTNVIPDRCRLEVDVRTVPGQDHDAVIEALEEKLGQFAREHGDFQFAIKPLLDRAPILSRTSDEIIQTALAIKGQGRDDCYGVPYYTDGSVLNAKNDIPTLIYGPGDEKLAHQPDEHVSIEAYLRAIDFYKQLIVRYLNSA